MSVTTAPARTGVPFAVTEITAPAREAVMEVLRSGWVTTGPQTQLFERELADHVGARDAVAVSSCTAALELTLHAMALPAGSPVLTPSLTFCGAVGAIVHAGLRPVLVDVDVRTLLPDEACVQAAARRAGRPAAMVVQHMAGHPVDVAALAVAAGLPAHRVVEDAAHGLGASLHGRPLGADSWASCLSFYATKNLPIGEGGAILTSDPDLASTLRRSRLHGMSKDAWRRYLPGADWRYDVEVAGFKANFTDVQAAIGRAQLRQLPAWQARRAELADLYDHGLAGQPGVITPRRPRDGEHAWHLYQVQITEPLGHSRDEVAVALAAQDIGTSVHFIPVHRLSWFRDLLGPAECSSVPVTDRVADRLLSLPLHPMLADSDVDRVCRAITSLTDRRRSS